MTSYWEIAANSAYDLFSQYKYLNVNFVFSHLGFWSGNIFRIAPFPTHCLLVPFDIIVAQLKFIFENKITSSFGRINLVSFWR